MTAIPHAPAASSGQVMWRKVLALYAHVEGRLAQAPQRRHGTGLSEFWAWECLAQTASGELCMREPAGKVGSARVP